MPITKFGLHTLITKSEARKAVINWRKEFTESEIRSKTKLVIDKFLALDDYFYANRVHVYISSRPGEVDTRQLIDAMDNAGKLILIPKLNQISKKLQRASFLGWDYLTKNNEGYFEPTVAFDEDLSDIDIVIIPAVAVSLKGQRVGYGGGYYDRLLKNSFAAKIVFAFEYQVFNNIETDLHDIRVDKVITERRVINTRLSNS